MPPDGSCLTRTIQLKCWHVLRSQSSVLRQEWEKTGQVPNVVFVEGMVRDRNRWLFYYGGADKYIGVAVAAR